MQNTLDDEAAYLYAAAGPIALPMQPIDVARTIRRKDDAGLLAKINDFSAGVTDNEFAAAWLTPDFCYAKPTDERLEHFTLRKEFKGTHSANTAHAGAVYEHPLNLSLRFDGEHVAALSASAQKNEVRVEHLQGVAGAYRPLSLVKWADCLVAYMEHWATEADIPSITIVPAKKQFWNQPGHMSNDLAEKRYDKTAQQRGYTLDNGLYRKSLTLARQA